VKLFAFLQETLCDSRDFSISPIISFGAFALVQATLNAPLQVFIPSTSFLGLFSPEATVVPRVEEFRVEVLPIKELPAFPSFIDLLRSDKTMDLSPLLGLFPVLDWFSAEEVLATFSVEVGFPLAANRVCALYACFANFAGLGVMFSLVEGFFFISCSLHEELLLSQWSI